MNDILLTVKCNHALVYLDDVIFIRNTPQEHIKDLSSVLKLLSEAGVPIKLKKHLLFTIEEDLFRPVIKSGKPEIFGCKADEMIVLKN